MKDNLQSQWSRWFALMGDPDVCVEWFTHRDNLAGPQLYRTQLMYLAPIYRWPDVRICSSSPMLQIPQEEQLTIIPALNPTGLVALTT